MEKLTKRIGDDIFVKKKDNDWRSPCYGCDHLNLCCKLDEAKKCNEYKAFVRLFEYEEMEEKELLFHLPCKIGDIVYRICPKCNHAHDNSCFGCAWEHALRANGCDVYGLWSDGRFPAEKCTIVPYKVTWNYIPNLVEHLGKTVFLTEEEAKDYLKGQM